MSELLYGKSNLQGIVGLVMADYGSAMKVWRRFGDKKTAHLENYPFHPFFHLRDIKLLKGFPREKFKWLPLAGDNYYQALVVFDNWFDMWAAKKHVLKNLRTSEWNPKQIYLIPNAPAQWLMQTGNTMFKGLDFQEVHRLQCDIESYSRTGFPNANREDNPVFIISMCDNFGMEMVLHTGPEHIVVENGVRFNTEEEMLQYWVDEIVRLDPDIIEGHNFLSFDMTYLMTRCERYGIIPALGRDGSVPEFYDSRIRFAERDIEYPAWSINGRHIIDTMFLVYAFDVVKRAMPGYGLKDSAKFFGFAREDREYIDGDKIAKTWDEDPERVLRYAMDDVYETKEIGRHLGGSQFALSRMVPMTYEKVSRSGSAAKIEAIMVREYLNQKHSIPTYEIGKMEVGGYTDIFRVGVFHKIVYADVASLYPSIMLNYNVVPKTDTLRVFPVTLKELTSLRFATKAKMKEHDKDSLEYQSLDHEQNAYKILINSYFGALGFNFFNFNDFVQADRVTTIGQGILRQMKREIEKDGGTVIEIDTDGILCIPPDWVYTKGNKDDGIRAACYSAGDPKVKKYVEKLTGFFITADDETWVKSLTNRMPEGIVVDFDGRATSMFSLRKKNYALDESGNLKMKGGSLKSRVIEPFRRAFVREVILALLEGDILKVHEIYVKYWTKVFTGDWTPDEFRKTGSVKESLQEYDRKVKLGVGNGGRNRDAAYEIAKKIDKFTDHDVVVGDRFAYYIAFPPNKPDKKKYKVRAFEDAKWVEEYANDENTNWYLGKLKDSAKKFKIFFSESDWKKVFTQTTDPDFDYSKVPLVNRAVKRRQMRIVISGSRNITHPFWLDRAIAGCKFLKLIEKADEDPTGFEIAEIIQGEASGVDTLAKNFAIENGIPHTDMPADWDNLEGEMVLIKTRSGDGKKYNALAGHNRNEEMAKYAMKAGQGDAALIAVWDGKSRGTKDMIEIAKKSGMLTYVSRVPEYDEELL